MKNRQQIGSCCTTREPNLGPETPRGVGARVRREGTHATLRLVHAVASQEPVLRCNTTILQWKINFKESAHCSLLHSGWLHQLAFPPTVQEGSLFSTSSSAFVVCRLFDEGYYTGSSRRYSATCWRGKMGWCEWGVCLTEWGKSERKKQIWYINPHMWNLGSFPGGTSKASAYQCRRPKRCGFDPRVWKIPWRRKWQPNPVFLPEKSHGQSLWGQEESDITERLSMQEV